MRGADGHRQRVDLGVGDEAHGLVGIGQQAGAIELAFEAVAVLGFAMAGFERAEAAEFAFDRGADHMGQARRLRR